MKFKTLRSKISKIFTENQQMKIVVFLSSIYWFFRKYFLGVEIDYPSVFLENWKNIKKNSSLDRERSFTIYQLINLHNQIFKNEETDIIEFGVSKGSSLITLCKFCKEKSNIYGIDSFGYFAHEIKKLSTSEFDTNYQGPEIAFNNKTRFSNFSIDELKSTIKNLSEFKNKNLYLIKCHFPNKMEKEDSNLISNKKYSFVYIDFDLHISILEALKFVIPKMKKSGILLIDDYNFINQEGCKTAVKEFGLDIDKCYQTQNGQLIYFNI